MMWYFLLAQVVSLECIQNVSKCTQAEIDRLKCITMIETSKLNGANLDLNTYSVIFAVTGSSSSDTRSKSCRGNELPSIVSSRFSSSLSE